MNALDYLLKANLYGLFFAGCYFLLLHRHTFLTINRLYLLLAVVLTLTLPLVSLTPAETEHLPAAVPVGVLTLPVTSVAPVAPAPKQATGPDWAHLVGIAYSLIALGLLARVGWRVWQLRRLIRQSVRRPQGRFTLVLPTAASVATFSFFRYIILNPADVGNAIVLRHEQVHVRQWHSADVLGTAIVRAVAWGCPALWLLDRALRQVHEFLADRDTIQQVTQPIEYTQFLVDYAFGVRPEPLTNGFFNPTLLKQRIQMLHRRATTRWALGKYVLLLPLSLALLAMTSVPDQLVSVINQATEKPITVKGQVTSSADGKPLAGVDIVVRGKQKGTSTDMNGVYVIQTAPTESLTFSLQGFKTYTVPLRSHSHKTKLSLNVSLQQIAGAEATVFPNQLARVIVTAQLPTRSTDSANAIVSNTAAEKQPQFPGGMTALEQYLAKNLRYPYEAAQNKRQGTVFVQFLVTATGAIRGLRILKSVGDGCDEEALRVISQMPNWKPGLRSGQPVAVHYVLPVQFILESVAETAPEPQKKRSQLWRPSGEYPDYSTSKDRYSLPLPDSLRLLTSPSATVRISNLSEKNPLFVVDGVAVDNIKNLDPNSIDNITVLKDGAATTTYGDKGKNGVIFIKTKKP